MDKQIEQLTYFILSRKLFESAIWRDEPHILKLFIYLIGTARHSEIPKKFPNFEVKRGELVTSLSQIAENNEYIYRDKPTKWSKQKVSRMITILEKQGYISRVQDTYGTHLKVCNYDTYQSQDTYKRTQVERKWNATGTQLDTYNNDKNVKNGKNVYKPPTLKEIQDYINEKKISWLDIDKFFNFYESKGWMVGKNKMKNWKAAIQTWKPSIKEEENNGQYRKLA